jgi:hypothetical protein
MSLDPDCSDWTKFFLVLNKKSRYPKFLASDSGPTIQFFNLQRY